MFDYIDKYCERISPGLWGEPFNLVSNIAFIFAAILLFRSMRSLSSSVNRNNWDSYCLISLVFAVGIGSTLWHATATKWALFSDVIPILIFINVYILSCSIRLLGLSILPTVLLFIIYHIVNFSFGQIFPKDYLNGSIFYVPVFLYLIPILVFIWIKKLAERKIFLVAVVLFGVSLVFRTIDKVGCDVFPIGTHFIWHICNAGLLYLFMKALMNHQFVGYKSKSINL